jgi:hypothetical protein
VRRVACRLNCNLRMLSAPDRVEQFYNELADAPNLQSTRSRNPKARGCPRRSEIGGCRRGSCPGRRRPPTSPSGMTFQWKMLPSTSGGKRGETFSKEFRARLSWMMALSRSCEICFSNTRMQSRLASLGPLLSGKPSQELGNNFEGLSTYCDDNEVYSLWGGGCRQ